MPDILVVEDEAHIADVVEFLLREHGFTCRRAVDGSVGWRLYRESAPDLVLLDLGLPGMTGLDLFREIRKREPGQPIIMLTARNDEIDRVLGLELGADDYVTKPFSNRELVARVKSVLRRCQTGQATSSVLRIGPLELEPEGFRARLRGRDLDLARHEIQLLHALMRHPSHVFTRERLQRDMYGEDLAVTERTVDTAVSRMRAKARAIDAGIPLIDSIYGIGYKLAAGLSENGA